MGGGEGGEGVGVRRARRGKMKEKVLPEPVGAQARMSRLCLNPSSVTRKKEGDERETYS